MDELQARLVVAAGDKDQFPEKRAILAHHANVIVGDEQPDRLPGLGLAQPDVAETAEVALSDVAGLADPILTDP